MRNWIVLLSIVLIPAVIFMAWSETTPRSAGIPRSADEVLPTQSVGTGGTAANTAAKAGQSAGDNERVIAALEEQSPPQDQPRDPQIQKEIDARIQKEIDAWKELMPRFWEICANNIAPEQLLPSEAIKVTNCITDVVDANVIPDLAYPELVMAMRERALENAKAYSSGSISNAEYIQKGAENWVQYLNELETRASTPERGSGSKTTASPSAPTEDNSFLAGTPFAGKEPVILIWRAYMTAMPEIKASEEIIMQFESMELCEQVKKTHQHTVDQQNKESSEFIMKLQCTSKLEFLAELEAESEQEMQQYRATQERVFMQELQRKYR